MKKRVRPDSVRTFVAVIALAAMSVLRIPTAGARDTELCNARVETSILMEVTDAALFEQLQALTFIRVPGNALHERLWHPSRVQTTVTAIGRRLVLMRYPAIQDVDQITRMLRQDPVLAAGTTRIRVNVGGCVPLLPIDLRPVAEYVNDITGHYFLSSNPVESQGIESGAAGPGWHRTGYAFQVGGLCPDGAIRRQPVYRFYSPAVNTHFFTLDPQECGTLRRHPADWKYEGVAFLAAPTVGGQCVADNPRPVYRLYNDRAAEGDTNHRFTTDPAVVGHMIGEGWIPEGIAFCLPSQP